jgi:hypothetical protein
MANNSAYVCDIKSEQLIEGKKSFKKEVEAPAFVLKDGPTLAAGADHSLTINGPVHAHHFKGTFSGDASGLSNFSVKNMNTSDIHPSIEIQSSDFLLVQRVLEEDSDLKKIKINDLLALIPTKNGVYYNFVTNGTNVGGGAPLFKKRVSSGRSETLAFRTLKVGGSLQLLEEESTLEIRLGDRVSIKNLQVDEAFIAPRCDKDLIENPAGGMIVYDDETGTFYGYAKDRWVSLNRYTSHF